MEYTIKTQSFEGPLDLLLHLITKAQVDIKDIFVSEITQQYLNYIHQMEVANMEIASEFLTMAATLMYIKSRSLLPTKDDEEEIDEEKLLIEQLEDYKRIKQVSEQLRTMESGAAKNFYKLPEEYTFQDAPLNLEGIGMLQLFETLQELLDNAAEVEAREPVVNVIRPERFTVRERIAMIRRKLKEKGKVAFNELFEQSATRGEIIATFVALLDMMSAGQVSIQQRNRFGQIMIAGKEGN
ncbi:segregation/condensation protein A [Eubacteriales bacterium OttesenSCG-928-N14]|nr:segregation/condensation protein A [Eubacteriales bacterium OttesenSCG-928-N14]